VRAHVEMNSRMGPRGDRGAIDWTAITALMATLIALASLFTVMRVVREMRHERREARFTVAVDALWRLSDDWSSNDLAEVRSSAATSLLANRAADDIDAVLRFFDRLAFLTHHGGFDDELIWHEFYWPLVAYWYASEDYRLHLRQEDAPRWKDLDALVQRMIAVEARHREKAAADVVPTKEQVREFLLTEVSAGECSENEEADVGPL
jgi:hypothetical protein